MTNDLETILLAMTALGRPRLSQHKDGWFCAIDMYVAAKGAAFKIDSDFGHASPHAAAQECLERVRKIVGGIATAVTREPAAGSLTHG